MSLCTAYRARAWYGLPFHIGFNTCERLKEAVGLVHLADHG